MGVPAGRRAAAGCADPGGGGPNGGPADLFPCDSVWYRDVSQLPFALLIPWEGTFRWRVSSRDAEGLESRPSEEGLICVVEK